MIAQKCYSYILIGLYIRLLVNVNEFYTKKEAISSLENFKSEIINANFEVTLSFINNKNYESMLSSLVSLDNDNESIGSTIATTLNKQFEEIESVVYAESSTKNIYILPQRRFNSDFLQNHPEKLFAKGVFEKLTDIPKQDITSACKCLLYGQGTATAFHILRTTEAVLKNYYHHHIKRNRVKRPMMGNMIEHLKTKKKPSKNLLESLDSIRKDYRNPTNHPEAIYNIDEAQDLFGICLNIIGKMAKEIP